MGFNSFIWLGLLIISISAFGEPTHSTSRSQFIFNGETVFDSKTGLSWQRCSYGLTWSNAQLNCIGTVEKLNHAELQAFEAQSQNSVWHLPTADELATLFDMANKGIKINQAAFPDVNKNNGMFWTAIQPSANFTWYMDFAKGQMAAPKNDQFKQETKAIRLVDSTHSKLSPGD